MHITDYITREVDDLELFESVWKLKHKREPRVYPLEMDDEEWREQFESWQTASDNRYNDLE